MGDVTDLYQIPYITDEDLVGSTPDVDKAQAERIDYLFSVNTGPDGKSAYDIYVESVQPPDTPLSEEDWLESLNGDVGASEYDKLLPAHQEPVELADTQFGHLLLNNSHAPLNYYPIGTVIEWAGTHVDNGWLWCDGKAYDYTKTGNKDLGALYSVIGHTYGGSGAMFAVPDKRSSVDECHYIIYAGGDTTAVTSHWQNPNVGEHLLEGGGGGGGIVSFAESRYISNNIFFNSTSWTDFDSATDLTLEASEGDIVEISLAGFWQNSSAEKYIDCVTVVNGSAVNSLGHLTAASSRSAGSQGIVSYKGATDLFQPASGSYFYKLKSNDVSNESVVLRLQARLSASVGATFYANVDYPFVWSACNHGAPGGNSGGSGSGHLKSSNIVQGTKDTQQDVTSTSFVDITGLSATIKPSSPTSKILVTAVVQAGAPTSHIGFIQLFRNSTELAKGSQATNRATFLVYPSINPPLNTYSVTYVDEPGTTEYCTYKLMGKALTSGHILCINRPGVDGATTVFSSITAQEII